MARGDAGVLGRWVFVTGWRWGLLRSSPRVSLCLTDPRADAHCLPGLSRWWDKWATQERRAEQNNLWPNVSKSCSPHHHGNEQGRDNNSGGGGPESRFFTAPCLRFPEMIFLFFHRGSDVIVMHALTLFLPHKAPGKWLYFSQGPAFSRISLNECNFESLHTGMNGY